MDKSENRSEIPGKFRNVVLEKDGKHIIERKPEGKADVTGRRGTNVKMYCMASRKLEDIRH